MKPTYGWFKPFKMNLILFGGIFLNFTSIEVISTVRLSNFFFFFCKSRVPHWFGSRNHLILYVLTPIVHQISIELNFENMPREGMRSILNDSNNLYVGPTIEFHASYLERGYTMLCLFRGISTMEFGLSLIFYTPHMHL